MTAVRVASHFSLRLAWVLRLVLDGEQEAAQQIEQRPSWELVSSWVVLLIGSGTPLRRLQAQ